ncbi:MAG: epimerase [Herpetosiphonaceae bacterium]|nr:epimerase [Herpetosiphonaceae bacterium]
MTKEREALDMFGALLMKRVRDGRIGEWDVAVTGGGKSEQGLFVRELLQSFDAQQIDAIRQLIPRIVDTALHNLLWTLEQEEAVVIGVHTVAGFVPNLSEVSIDELCGELDEWILRLSSKHYPGPPYDGYILPPIR